MAKYVPGQYVRRRDALGRPYYVPRAGGQRVKAQIWREERTQIRTRVERARKEAEVAAERGEVPSFDEREPFPPSIEGVRVSEFGVPDREVWVDEDGVEWELPKPVQGEDDTP